MTMNNFFITEYEKIDNKFVFNENGKQQVFEELGICYKLVNGFIKILSHGNYDYVYESFVGNRKFFNPESNDYKKIKIIKIFPEDTDIKDLNYLLATKYLQEKYLDRFLFPKSQ